MNTYYKSFLKKINENKNIVIGFIGGSITEGSLATIPDNCYAYRVFSWFEETYPNCKFEYINCGVGGTTSYFGVSRVEKDLLQFNPDFVIVDFSVNDENKDFFKITFEGLIRKIITWDTKPAVCVLNNVFYNNGNTCEKIHNEITKYYNIPFASMKSTVYKKIVKNELLIEDITPDNLHPNDFGHELIANELIKVIKSNLEKSKETNKHKNKDKFEIEKLEPFTENTYENAKLWNRLNSMPEVSGFIEDKSEVEYFGDHFKNGWEGKNVGDKIIFFINCKSLGIQYRKTINKPAPIGKVTIDDDDKTTIILDSNFTEDWGDCLFLQRVINNKEEQLHKIEIEIVESSNDHKASFYLLSIIST